MNDECTTCNTSNKPVSLCNKVVATRSTKIVGVVSRECNKLNVPTGPPNQGLVVHTHLTSVLWSMRTM